MNETYKTLKIKKALKGLLTELAYVSARLHPLRAFFVFKEM